MAAYSIDELQKQLSLASLSDKISAGFLPLAGLTGQSFRVTLHQGEAVARLQPAAVIPFVNRKREYRLLRKLGQSGLVPRPLAGSQQALFLPWQPGMPLDLSGFRQHRQQIIRLISRLHHQPLTGYRLLLLPLLWRYWQLCRQRNPRWLRILQRLTRQGEPAPLRLAALHMDIHCGNILQESGELRLIDWEYAGDGDVALELAAICAADPQQAEAWLTEYAKQNQFETAALRRQIDYWRPWLQLLMASWYQLRAEQSGSPKLCTLAREAWRSRLF